jgi:hypothetical protein
MDDSREIPTDVIDAYRYVEVDNDDWFESVVDDWAASMALIGIDVHVDTTAPTYRRRHKVYFDLYRREVSFSADTSTPEEWRRLLDANPSLRERFPFFTQLVAYPGLDSGTAFEAKLDRSWTLGFDMEYRNALDFTSVMDPKALGYTLLQEGLEQEVDAVEAELCEIYRKQAAELLKDLAAEYDYYTSDEVVREFILSNVEEYRDD